MALTGWSTAAQAQLAGSTPRPAVLLRIAASTGPLRMWSGVGDLEIPADAVETAPAVYQGLGVLMAMPAVSQLVNGLAERIEFSLSGVTDVIRNLADSEAATVRGATCLIGFMVFDDNWQPLSPVAWIWEGTNDTIRTARKNIVRTIALSVGSMFSNRRLASLGYWTDAQQRQRSPTDAFCDHVAVYTEGTTRRFVPRS